MKFFIYFFIFLTIIIKNYKVECQQGKFDSNYISEKQQTISTGPVFIHRPQSQTGLTKGNLVLFCKGTGGNKLKIKWFRDDREVLIRLKVQFSLKIFLLDLNWNEQIYTL